MNYNLIKYWLIDDTLNAEDDNLYYNNNYLVNLQENHMMGAFTDGDSEWLRWEFVTCHHHRFTPFPFDGQKREN